MMKRYRNKKSSAIVEAWQFKAGADLPSWVGAVATEKDGNLEVWDTGELAKPDQWVINHNSSIQILDDETFKQVFEVMPKHTWYIDPSEVKDAPDYKAYNPNVPTLEEIEEKEEKKPKVRLTADGSVDEDDDEEEEDKTLTWKNDLTAVTATQGQSTTITVKVNEEADVTYTLLKDGTKFGNTNKTGKFTIVSPDLADNGKKLKVKATADGYKDLESAEVTYTVNAS